MRLRAGLLLLLPLAAAVARAEPDGARVWARRCAECHGERLPPRPVMLPRYRPLHAALALAPAEQRAVEAWLGARRREALAAPAPDLPERPGTTLADGGRPPLPPRWVLEPWKWKNEHSGPADVAADLDAMAAHGIPCGAYIIDAPWESGYNTLRFHAPRWGQPGEAVPGAATVADVQARGVKLLVWVTPVLNDGSDSSPRWDAEAERALFAEAERRGALYRSGYWDLTLGRGLAPGRLRWWKGVGAHLDLRGPVGRALYYELLDRALVELGVDGFKVDGGWPPLRTVYYDQTAAHTERRTRGRGVTLSRPLGGNLHSAVACWTGDEEPTWNGLRHALLRAQLAAQAGYSTVGSDIGGFGGTPSEAVLLRWAQVGCFSGVMELGGGGVHEPWEFGPRATEVYRRYARLRTELIPYLHSYAHVAWRSGTPLMRFAGGFEFACGDELHVAPILSDDGAVTVHLPSGRWRELLHPERVHAGGRALRLTFPLEDAAVFVREGALLPLETGEVAGVERAEARACLTLALYPGREEARRCELFQGDAPGVAPIELELRSSAPRVTVSLGGRAQPWPGGVLLRLHGRRLQGGAARYGGQDPRQLRRAGDAADLLRAGPAWLAGQPGWVWLPPTQEDAALVGVDLDAPE